MGILFKPIWFDSLGAKSSCTLVKTPDISILIDPGVAVMQPTFPASTAKKLHWKTMGKNAVIKASENVDVIVISHYHYDHYFPDEMRIYRNKLLLVKNPNEYINDSQRKRAENFYSKICECFGETKLENLLEERKQKKYSDPLAELPVAMHMDFGSYSERRKQLLQTGRGWFNRRVKKWNSSLWIPELEFKEIETRYSEGKKFSFGETKIRFTKPLFHGIEFSRVGWIFATVVQHEGEKLIHSSDMNGPIIEDYMEWIIKENPDILILDGPMTYMMGYLLNKTNLQRAVNNISRIVRESEVKLVIYDHHLPREARFRENTEEVWRVAKKLNKKLLTAAEFLGKTPKVLEKT